MKNLTGFTGVIPAPISPSEIGSPRKVVVVDGLGEILRVSLPGELTTIDVAREYFTPVYYRKGEGETDELIQAAKAVIERWDSPAWKDVPHTGEFIARLREAVLAVNGNA